MGFFIEIYDREESGLLETLSVDNGKLISVSESNVPSGKQEIEIKAVYKNVTESNLGYNNVVRLIDDDLTNDPYTAYRIKAVTKEGGEDNVREFKIKCEHLKYDLVEQLIDSTLLYVQRTPNDILDAILSAYASDWSRGTVTNGTTEIDSFEIKAGTSVYDAIKDLATEIGQEVDYHATGSDLGQDADYQEIDLVTIDNTQNGTPGTCTFQDGINILSLERTQDIRDNFFTRLYAFGGKSNPGVRDGITGQDMLVQGARFVVKSYSSGVITFYSKNILVANDSLNGYELYCEGPSGSKMSSVPTTITDSAKGASGDTVTVNAGAFSTAPAEGDFVIFYDGTTPLKFIPSGQSESTYGIVSEKYENTGFEDFINALGPNGRSDFSGLYGSGICAGWLPVIGSGTFSANTNTDYIKYGTKSQKMIVGDGDGIYRSFTPPVDAGEKYHVSFEITLNMNAVAADAYLHMRIQYDTDKFWPPGNIEISEGQNETRRLFGETFSGLRTYAIQGGYIEHVSGYTPKFQIYADGGNITSYIDSVALVFLPFVPMPDTFVPYDSRVLLHEDAVKWARLNMSLNQNYNIDIVDLYELNRSTYAAYQFEKGDTVTVTHSKLGISENVRVVEKTTPNKNRPHECSIKIESLDNGIASKIGQLFKSVTKVNNAIAANSNMTNNANRANMAGFYSVVEKDANSNILSVGKYIDQSLINGTWREDRRLTWNKAQ